MLPIIKLRVTYEISVIFWFLLHIHTAFNSTHTHTQSRRDKDKTTKRIKSISI